MEADIRGMVLISVAFSLLGGLAEALHPGAGGFPAGLAMGVWLSAGWIYLRTSE